MSDSRNTQDQKVIPQESHSLMSSDTEHYIQDGIEVADHVTHISKHPLAKVVHKILKPVTIILEGSDVVRDYKENRHEGHSTLASTTGAAAGFLTRRGLETAAFLESNVAAGAIETGIGIPLGLLAAGTAVKTLQQKNAASHAMNYAVAHGVDMVEEQVANSEMYYSMAGVDEPGILIPKSLIRLTTQKPNQRLDEKPKQHDVEIETKKDHAAQPSTKETAHEQAPVRSESSTQSQGATINNQTMPDITLTPEDKQTAEFLIDHGASPTQVETVYHDKESWQIAKDAAFRFAENEKKLEGLRNQAECIQIFQGVGAVCDALSQCKSAELRHIGRLGTPIMSALVHVETLWGVFSGGAGSLATVGVAGSFFAIGGLVAAGICLLDRLFGSDDEAQQRQLMDSLNAIYDLTATVRREMHERFDRVDYAIQHVAGLMTGYCHQIIQNQKVIFEQNKRLFELSLHGFRSITTLLNDFRAENRLDHERIFSQFSYVTGLQEVEILHRLKKSIAHKIAFIQQKNEDLNEPELDELDQHLCRESMKNQFSELASDLKDCVSAEYNGQEQFDLMNRDPKLAVNFLKGRAAQKDDALGFLLEATKDATGKEFSGDESKLPVTSLWSNTVRDYISLSHLPALRDCNTTAVLKEIKEQSDTLLEFLKYIKTSGVIDTLLQRHKEYLYELQDALHQAFTQNQRSKPGIKDKKSDESLERKLTVREYCAGGVAKAMVDNILYKIDYNYLLVNKLAYLGGYSQAFQKQLSNLDRSTNLLDQSFNFNETPTEAYASSLHDATQIVAKSKYYDIPYYAEHLESAGALILPGSATMGFFNTMAYSADRPDAKEHLSLSVDEYDVRTSLIVNGQRVNSRTPAAVLPFPLLEYKQDYHRSANHAWASYLPVNQHVVLFSGGSGYVSLYNTGSKTWQAIDTTPQLWPWETKSSQSELKFSVPLPPHAQPDTTSYTHVLHDRYLHITKLKWQGRNAPLVDFQVVDLEEKRRLNELEVKKLFSHWYWGVESIQCKVIRGCDLFLMATPATAEYKNSDYWHLYLYKDSSGNLFYLNNNQRVIIENRQLAQFNKSSLVFNQPSNQPVKCTDQHTIETILTITSNQGHTQLPTSVISPNQFYINTIKPVGKPTALVYGILQPLKTSMGVRTNQLNVSFHYQPIREQKSDALPVNNSTYVEVGFPITAKMIHQTHSESLFINGENKLYIPTTFTNAEGAIKLAMISVDYFKNSYHSKEFVLPAIHPNSDWQAMRTAVARIGDRDHLYIALLSPDYQILIFSYDPKTETLSQLMNGPQLQFVQFGKDVNFPTRIRTGQEDMDHHLLAARKKYPGFYPVRPIELRVSHIDGVSLLHVTYPTVAAGSDIYRYDMRVASIPLTPHLQFKALPTVPSQTVSSSAAASPPAAPAPVASTSASTTTASPSVPVAADIPASHLANDLSKNYLLLMLAPVKRKFTSPEKKAEASSELPSENILKPAYDSCDGIIELVTLVVDEVKLSDSAKKSVENNLKLLTDLARQFKKDEKPSLALYKKSLLQLQEFLKIINKIDGFLKLSNNKYASNMGKNINLQIEQLKDEIETLKSTINKPSSSVKPLKSLGLFSSSTNMDEATKKLMYIINNNMDLWSKCSVPASASLKEELNQEAKKWGLTCKDMKEDGNCLFHAIADQLALRANNTSETHATLREKALAHILQHQEEYKPFIAEDFEKFIAENVQNRAWADSVMIQALSRVLNMTIVIVRSDHEDPTIIKQMNPKPNEKVKNVPVLYIGFEVERHYQSLEGNSSELRARVDAAEVDTFTTHEKRAKVLR